jgi:hypothetical protein
MGDPTAILTKGQRQYLEGDKEPTQDRTMRTRIRRRVQIALTNDLPLLVEKADPEDLLEGGDSKGLRRGLEATVKLVYKLADAEGHDPDDLLDDAVRGLRHSRADEVWDALERGDIRAHFEELKVLRNGGRIPEEVYTAAFRRRLGDPDGLTIEEIVEAWEETREQPADPAELFESSIGDGDDFEDTDDAGD